MIDPNKAAPRTSLTIGQGFPLACFLVAQVNIDFIWSLVTPNMSAPKTMNLSGRFLISG